MASNITGDFTTARGVTDMDCVLQVERFDKRREIVSVGIQVVAVPGLAGPALAAAVMSNAAVAAEARKNICPQRRPHSVAIRG
jgi:hypothetical protein